MKRKANWYIDILIKNALDSPRLLWNNLCYGSIIYICSQQSCDDIFNREGFWSFLMHSRTCEMMNMSRWRRTKIIIATVSLWSRAKHRRRSKAYRSPTDCVDDRRVIAMESIIHDPLNLGTALFRRVIGISAYLLAHTVFQRSPLAISLRAPLTFFRYHLLHAVCVHRGNICSED